MVIDEKTYKQMKKEVTGYYYEFNTKILKWHMRKIFSYEFLIDSVKDCKNFEEYFKLHTSPRKELIKQHLFLMEQEANSKGIANTTKKFVQYCLIVRLGNIYTGVKAENHVHQAFKNLGMWNNELEIHKAKKKVDLDYKVDFVAVLEKEKMLGIQIKPISFRNYDKGDELQFHMQFKEDYGYDVIYVFYDEDNNILLNNEEVNLWDIDELTNKLILIIKKKYESE